MSVMQFFFDKLPAPVIVYSQVGDYCNLNQEHQHTDFLLHESQRLVEQDGFAKERCCEDEGIPFHNTKHPIRHVLNWDEQVGHEHENA